MLTSLYLNDVPWNLLPSFIDRLFTLNALFSLFKNYVFLLLVLHFYKCKELDHRPLIK